MVEMDGWGPGVSRPSLDPVASRLWLGAVHDAMRSSVPPGAVDGLLREPGPGWNYYSILVRVAGQGRRLLLNVPARLVACALDQQSQRTGSLRFCEVDCPEVYAAAGFRVASVDQMEAPLRVEDIGVLDRDEQRDIAYHQPETIGGVLFNWFD